MMLRVSIVFALVSTASFALYGLVCLFVPGLQLDILAHTIIRMIVHGSIMFFLLVLFIKQSKRG